MFIEKFTKTNYFVATKSSVGIILFFKKRGRPEINRKVRRNKCYSGYRLVIGRDDPLPPKVLERAKEIVKMLNIAKVGYFKKQKSLIAFFLSSKMFYCPILCV